MVKSSTPTFITTIPLRVDSQAEAELKSRFQAGRQLYNALLSEAMVRANLVKQSDLYQQAKKLPRGQGRTQQFTKARQVYRYSDYDLQAYATVVANRSKWMTEKIDSNTQQKLATRAFKASERVLLGSAKNVRFKVPSQFKSLEGKTNKQGIRWKNNQLVWCGLTLLPKRMFGNTESIK
jgi:hypothetical protein